MYKVDLIPIGQNRSGKPMSEIKGIVVHWVANTGTSAKNNRNYFATTKTYASSHDIIDLNGDILHIIPYNEVAYHCGSNTYTDFKKSIISGNPNYYLIGIEMCHESATGEPGTIQEQSLINLLTDLCRQYSLLPENIYLHQDITGKWCHKWYCDNPEKWAQVKEKVRGNL